MTGQLYLLANLLDDAAEPAQCLPANCNEVIQSLDLVICENEKSARRFLGRFKRASLPLLLLNEHTKADELQALLQPLIEGKKVGLISDAGLPCIADPGANLVALARSKGIPVLAQVGPCSIILALQLSGLGGQRFSFHGYLARERDGRKKSVQQIEQKSKREKSTEIFIEAPYRNQELLQDLLATLAPTTTLAVACDLTAPTQEVHVQRVAEWQKSTLPQINKRPTIFLVSA